MRSLLPAAPARIRVSPPICFPAIGSVGAIEREARIAVRTDHAATGSAVRVGAAMGALADRPDHILVAHRRGLIGHRRRHQRARHQHRGSRDREHGFAHGFPPTSGECYIASSPNAKMRRDYLPALPESARDNDSARPGGTYTFTG